VHIYIHLWHTDSHRNSCSLPQNPIYKYMYIHVCICMNIYVHIYTLLAHRRASKFMQATRTSYMYLYIHTCMYTYEYIRTYVYICGTQMCDVFQAAYYKILSHVSIFIQVHIYIFVSHRRAKYFMKFSGIVIYISI